MLEEAAVKVFISYSWDSDHHKWKVLKLSQTLREHGIDCQIDRYHQSPPEGWYRWIMNQIEDSDFVLVICTEKYNLRYANKEEQGQGQGVTWEGGLIISDLYSGQGINDKFIPVLLTPDAQAHIPKSLKPYTVYRLFDEDYNLNQIGGYQDLYRHLTKQPAFVPAQLGKPQRLAPIHSASSNVGSAGEVIQPVDSRPSAPPSPTISLASEEGIDYTKLRDLLAAGDWRAADQETYRVMIRAVGKKDGDYFSKDELLNFPCTDLKTIDSLWSKYSKGHFGFSIQKQIWQECGSPMASGGKWNRFCIRVGWKNKEATAYMSYGALKFDLKNSSKGELPLLVWGVGFGFVVFWELFSRATTCEL